MAMKDYNSINFKNSAIDKMSKKFGKNDEPDPVEKANRVLPKLLSAIGSGIGTVILSSDKAIARRDERYKKRQEKKKEKANNK
jgi:hypothetical protein